MTRHFYLLLTLTALLICLIGCTHRSTGDLLTQAKRMQSASTDSMLFYLQQVREPGKLTGTAQANYCFLLYKATLWGTGKPKDSLLQRCIPAFLQAKDSTQWMQARIAQANSFLYTQQPDSALHYVALIEKEKQKMNDSLKAPLFTVAQIAHAQKGSYPQALQLADSCLTLAKRMNDTLFIYRTLRARLGVLEKMNRNDEFVAGSRELMQQLDASRRYRRLNYRVAESLVTFFVRNKDFAQALRYSQQLKHYQRSRYDVPYYQLIQGRIYDALHQTDSAKVYYTLASNSLSSYVAAEATSSLFRLMDAEAYPEQAFYLAQKEKEIHNNMELELNTRIETKKYNETKLQNELYQLRLRQQKQELWMMGAVIILLFIALVISFFYQYEKKRRLLSEQNRHKEQIEERARQLQHENLLLHKEAELSTLREKEACLRNKEHKLREAIFRHISFFHKLSSLHATDAENIGNSNPSNQKIEVTDAEWSEIRAAVNDGFDNFTVRLKRAYPQLTEKEIDFCCLVKINTSVQDLSDIYCVSKAAITKRKYRIKTEKLGVCDESSSLDQLLQRF